jgi:hypothetical protein
MLHQLARRFVVITLQCGFLWHKIHPLNQTVGLQMVRLCEPRLEAVFIKDVVEYAGGGVLACLPVRKTIYGASKSRRCKAI